MIAASLLPAGAVTGIGSLPSTDPAEASALVLRTLPDLPAAPQLPNRSPAESMLAQVTCCIPGVSTNPDGTLRVDEQGLDEPPAVTGLDEEAWRGTLAFLDGVTHRRGPVKLQLAGPVTVAVGLIEAGVEVAPALSTASTAVAGTARALVREAGLRAPGAPLVVFLDEPGLVAFADPAFPIDLDDAVDLLSGALAALGHEVVTGVHCCGATDWSLVLQAGPDILSLPVDLVPTLDGSAVAAFLDRGGWIAWGVVPTDRPVGERGDALWRSLKDAWADLTEGGCDPFRLRRQALFTPACGLAGHGGAQAQHILALTARLGQRLREQAVPTPSRRSG